MIDTAQQIHPGRERVKYGIFSSVIVLSFYFLYSIQSLAGPFSISQINSAQPFYITGSAVALLYLFVWSMVFALRDYTFYLLAWSLINTTLAVIFFRRKKFDRQSRNILLSNCFLGIPMGVVLFVVTASFLLLFAMIGGAILEVFIGRIRG